MNINYLTVHVYSGSFYGCIHLLVIVTATVVRVQLGCHYIYWKIFCSTLFHQIL